MISLTEREKIIHDLVLFGEQILQIFPKKPNEQNAECLHLCLLDLHPKITEDDITEIVSQVQEYRTFCCKYWKQVEEQIQ